MSVDSRPEFASKIHDYYAHYIDNADAKSGALLTGDFAVGGLLLANLPSGDWARAVSWVAVGFLAGSVLACLDAMFPRLPGKSTGLIFWEDVHRLTSPADYAAAVTRLSPTDVEEAWATNAFYVANVLHRKFWGIRIALVTTVAGLLSAGVTLPLR